MKVKFYGELRRVERNEFKRRNGETGVSYRMLVEQGTSSMSILGTEALDKCFEQIKTYQGCDCVFEADYHPTWKFNQFQVTDIDVV